MEEIYEELVVQNDLSLEVKKTSFYTILGVSAILGIFGFVGLVSGFIQSENTLSFVKSFFGMG